MKILHTADIHLGVKLNKLPIEKQKIFQDEAIYNIKKFFREAKDQSCDVILICGDLFHSKNVKSSLVKAFFEGVEWFSNPVIYIEGNHDETFILPEDLPSNFVVLGSKLTNWTYKNVAFYSAKDNFQLDFDKFNILLLHGNIENTRDNDYIDISDYLKAGFDYIALGHVHQMKKYKANCLYAYPGSLFSFGFDECGEKGYLLLDFKDKNINSLEFVPFKCRKFLCRECDITNALGNDEIIEKIKNSLSDASKQDFVRVILKGKYDEESEKSNYIITKEFDDYFYFELVDQTTIKIDMEKYKNEKLSFKFEFIKLVEESDLSADQKRLICECGIEALKGGDISL